MYRRLALLAIFSLMAHLVTYGADDQGENEKIDWTVLLNQGVVANILGRMELADQVSLSMTNQRFRKEAKKIIRLLLQKPAHLNMQIPGKITSGNLVDMKAFISHMQHIKGNDFKLYSPVIIIASDNDLEKMREIFPSIQTKNLTIESRRRSIDFGATTSPLIPLIASQTAIETLTINGSKELSFNSIAEGYVKSIVNLPNLKSCSMQINLDYKDFRRLAKCAASLTKLSVGNLCNDNCKVSNDADTGNLLRLDVSAHDFPLGFFDWITTLNSLQSLKIRNSWQMTESAVLEMTEALPKLLQKGNDIILDAHFELTDEHIDAIKNVPYPYLYLSYLDNRTFLQLKNLVPEDLTIFLPHSGAKKLIAIIAAKQRFLNFDLRVNDDDLLLSKTATPDDIPLQISANKWSEELKTVIDFLDKKIPFSISLSDTSGHIINKDMLATLFKKNCRKLFVNGTFDIDNRAFGALSNVQQKDGLVLLLDKNQLQLSRKRHDTNNIFLTIRSDAWDKNIENVIDGLDGATTFSVALEEIADNFKIDAAFIKKAIRKNWQKFKAIGYYSIDKEAFYVLNELSPSTDITFKHIEFHNLTLKRKQNKEPFTFRYVMANPSQDELILALAANQNLKTIVLEAGQYAPTQSTFEELALTHKFSRIKTPISFSLTLGESLELYKRIDLIGESKVTISRNLD